MPAFLWRIRLRSFHAFHVSFCATRGLKLLDFSASAASNCAAQSNNSGLNFGYFSIFVALAGQHTETSSIEIAHFRLVHAT
jgi:hypothetical protein